MAALNSIAAKPSILKKWYKSSCSLTKKRSIQPLWEPWVGWSCCNGYWPHCTGEMDGRWWWRRWPVWGRMTQGRRKKETPVMDPLQTDPVVSLCHEKDWLTWRMINSNSIDFPETSTGFHMTNRIYNQALPMTSLMALLCESIVFLPSHRRRD